MLAFLQETFRHFSGSFRAWEHKPSLDDTIRRAVEHVLDETFSNIRALPNYARRLSVPVATAFVYIDELVDSIPKPFLCSRNTFRQEPRVNGFFVNPQHLQETFSASEEVRTLFAEHPDIEECCALLCMHKRERLQLGMALDGDTLQRDVMQTAVSFSDHQIVSPGSDEAHARRALKCCIFNSLLDYVRSKANRAKAHVIEQEGRLRTLRKHLRQAEQQGTVARPEWSRQLEEVEQDLMRTEPRLVTVEDYFTFLAQVLGKPENFIRSRQYPMHLTRMGIKLENQEIHSASHELLLSEIQIASKEPRIAALVRFPRKELLPRQSFLKKADLFLSIL